jgi:hypothetical protein
MRKYKYWFIKYSFFFKKKEILIGLKIFSLKIYKKQKSDFYQ